MKSKKLLALLLALVMVLALAACGGSETPEEPETPEVPETPETPETPEVPETPETPEEPETPKEPETPEEPEDPGVSLVNMDIPEGSALGERLHDFSFTTYDGKEYSLYETLKTKDMVLINIWATWCGPCRNEFPFMTEAYEEYKDDIEIFALSTEPTDSDEVLADYVSEMGMTFPVGRDVADLSSLFRVTGIPTSIAIDRYGVISLIEVGSQDAKSNFERLFDVYIGDGYTESVTLDGIPGPKPTVDPIDPETLSAALNAEGGAIAFENPTGAYDWPMKVMNKNDRSYAISTNKNVSNTTSMVNFTLEVNAGDVLAFDYLVSSEEGFDFLTLYRDGKAVKSFSGNVSEWSTWGYEFAEAGTYSMAFAYEKDPYTDEGSDYGAVDEVRLLSAADGAEILANQPKLPVSDVDSITPAVSGAAQIVINDPTSLLDANFPGAVIMIIPGADPSFNVTLTGDPGRASVGYFADGAENTATVADKVDGDKYTVPVVSSKSSTYSYVTLYADPGVSTAMILYFDSEEAVNTFLTRNLQNEDGTMAASWKYADGTAPSTTAIKEGSDAVAEGSSLYNLVFVDQNGDPVPGVTANVCNDDSCIPMVSDDNGIVSFVFPSLAYHIQVIKVPDGYTFDTTQELYTAENGGVMTFTVTKD